MAKGIQVKGLSTLEAQINEIPQRTMNGVKMAIEHIYKMSQPLVPVDTGRLKRSGKITKLEDGYQLHYRAENPKNGYNYAPIQHENTHFKHKVGQAKYVEQPIITDMDNIKKIISTEVLK